MKKITMLLLGMLLIFTAVSCNNNQSNKDQVEEERIYYPIEEPKYDPVIEDVEFETPKIESEVTVPNSTLKVERANFNTYLKTDDFLDGKTYCPSIGKPKILVVPVNFDSNNCTNAVLKEIKTAYVGTEEETGWESLKTYYYKSSYGKLDFDITITGWYTPTNSLYYYSRSQASIFNLAKEILEFYDRKYDYNDFDSDKDGYIDGLQLVYNCSTDYTGSNSFWAYTGDICYLENDNTTFDNVKPGKFVFSGIDFFHDTHNYEPYDITDILVDAHTIIHESGHMIGIADYYDYEKDVGASGGLYKADIMDYNMGDHNPISKILMGWIEPLIITGKGALTIDLDSYAKCGDFIILADHELTSIYDEFFIIEYYTEDGLNKHDKPIKSIDGFEVKGIRITHVDATMYKDSEGNIAKNENTRFKDVFLYDNSKTEYKFITCLVKIGKKERMQANDLYVDGDVFGVDYYKNYTLHTDEPLFFTLSVNSITDVANITIEIGWGE